jgi:hypothetical protein
VDTLQERLGPPAQIRDHATTLAPPSEGEGLAGGPHVPEPAATRQKPRRYRHWHVMRLEQTNWTALATSEASRPERD